LQDKPERQGEQHHRTSRHAGDGEHEPAFHCP